MLLSLIVFTGALAFAGKVPSKIATWIVVVLTILGVFQSPDVPTRLLFVGAAMAGPILLYVMRIVIGLTILPLKHYFTFKQDAHRELFNVIPGDADDRAAAEQVEQHATSLVTTGFVRRGRIALRVGQATVVNEFLDRGDGREWAILTATIPAKRQPVILHSSCEFANGETLAVNNYPFVDPAPPSPGNETIRLPSLSDANDIVRACLTLAGRVSHEPVVRTPLITDLAARAKERLRIRYEAERQAGWLRYDATLDVYRPTLRTAYRSYWRSLPPLNGIVDRQDREFERQLLAEMKLTPAARGDAGAPSPQPTRRQFVKNLAYAAGMTAIIVFVPDLPDMVFGRPAPRVAPGIDVTSDIAVPDSFAGAVQALEQWLGRPSHQLIGTRDDEPTPTPGVAISMRSDSADAYVAVAHRAFLSRGFYLFRTGERATSGLETDAVALYPTRDPYEIMRAMETNGSNHGMSTEDVIAWFRRESAQYPIQFEAIAFDYVGGRLPGELPDETSFARRFIRFCPDIQAEGPVSARSLGKDFKRTRQIYCWWD
jgi:hypothetical protein